MQRTIDRISRLLEALARTGAAGTGELAAATGLPATTCSRLLKGLARAGWVDQDANRGAYRLGPRVHALAEARPYHEGLLAAAQPALRALVRRHPGCGAVVVALRPWQRIGLWGCGDGRSADGRMDLTPEPVWQGASGRLLLALLPPRQRRRWIAQVGLPMARQWKGVATTAELAAALADIRRAGHCVAVHADGTVAIAVGVRRGDGHAALGLHHRGRRPEAWVLPELRSAAAGVEAALA